MGVEILLAVIAIALLALVSFLIVIFIKIQKSINVFLGLAVRVSILNKGTAVTDLFCWCSEGISLWKKIVKGETT